MDGTNLEEIKINPTTISNIMSGNYKVPTYSMVDRNIKLDTDSREFSIDLKKSRNLKTAFILGIGDEKNMGKSAIHMG